MPKIALVDDDRNILTSLSILLEEEGFEVDTYTNGRAALAAFSQKAPDIAVCDVKMPQMDGLELLERVRKKAEFPIVMLSSKDDEVDEVIGLRMGADDYVKKPFSQRILLERIRCLLRRQESRFVMTEGDAERGRNEILTRGHLVMDELRQKVCWKGLSITMTVTEFQILRTLAERPQFIKTREQLMDVVYGNQIYVDDRTIDSHIKRIRNKFRAIDPDFSAVKTMYGLGYKFDDQEGSEGLQQAA